MEGQVLVAHCSKHGATAEIAEKIGQVLAEAGLDADVQTMDRRPDPGEYRAVVLGSAVYYGGWRKSAKRFLQSNEGQLTDRPVWLFSSGPTGQGEPAAFMKGEDMPASLQPVVDTIRPRGIAVFRGSVEMEKLGVLEKWVVKRVDSPVGDFRDWDAITGWALGIAEALKSEVR